MIWQPTPYTIPLLAAAAVSVVSAIYVWTHPSTSASRVGAILLLAGAIWISTHVLSLASANLPAKIFWNKLRFLGTGVIPTAWLIYVKQYTAGARWLTRRRLLLLSIVPVIMLLLSITNEQHGLFYVDVRLNTRGDFATMESSQGLALWGYIIYSYALLGIGVVVLVQALIRSGHLYRWQASALLLTVLTLWLASFVMDTLGWKPFANLEAAPLALALTLPTFAWSFRRLRIRDIVPVARDAIVDGMIDGVMVLDELGRVVDLNTTAQRLMGRDRSRIIAMPVDRVWPEWSSQIASHRDDGSPVGEMQFNTARGRSTYDVRISSMNDWRNKVVSRVVVLRDITERKQAEEETLRLKAFNESILQSIAEGVTAVDLKGHVVFVNLALARLLGYTEEALEGEHWTTFVSPDQQSIVRSADERRAKGLADTYELTLARQDGTRVEVLVSGSPLHVGGSFSGTVAAFSDITELKRAEAQIKESLREKEVLLQEIHHRVKNNLQVIASLLNLQSNNFGDPLAAEVFRESQDRVYSMALIHEQLYQSENLAQVDFGHYARELAAHLHGSYGAPERGVRLQTDVGEVFLGIDTAVPCGLILNELVSNALKHAFPDGRTGEISIGLCEDGEDVALTVRDDGVGIPEGLDLQRTDSLGLKLVAILVEQLDGVIDIERSSGTAFTVTFRLLPELTHSGMRGSPQEQIA